MCGDLADDGKLVGGMFFEGVSLETEQGGAGEKQRDAANHHDHEGDFLADRAVAQVLHTEVS